MHDLLLVGGPGLLCVLLVAGAAAGLEPLAPRLEALRLCAQQLKRL